MAAGSDQVQDGLKTASSGISLLNSKLADGADQVKNVNADPQNVNHFVNPVSQNETLESVGSVKNIFAPLVIAMVLFIAAILNQLGQYARRKGHRHSGFGLSNNMLLLLTLLQVVGVLAFVGIDGISVVHPIGLVVAAAITAVSFTTLCVFIDLLFGAPGILFSLVLMLVQLAGVLLPTSMLTTLYHAISELLPATHAMSAFNYAINGVGNGMVLQSVIVLLYPIVIGGIYYFVTHRQKLGLKNVKD